MFGDDLNPPHHRRARGVCRRIVIEKALYWNAGGEIFAAGTGVVATRLPPP